MMKSLLKKIGTDRFLILAIAGILLLTLRSFENDIAFNLNKNKQKTSIKYGNSQQNIVTEGDNTCAKDNTGYEKEVEIKLTRLIQSMDGAGKTLVMVMTNGSEQKIVEKDAPYVRENETSSDDSRNEEKIKMENEEVTVFVEQADGTKSPFVSKRYSPKITGVVVACEGGDDEHVALEITEVCQALFDLDAHTIKVVKIKE